MRIHPEISEQGDNASREKTQPGDLAKGCPHDSRIDSAHFFSQKNHNANMSEGDKSNCQFDDWDNCSPQSQLYVTRNRSLSRIPEIDQQRDQEEMNRSSTAIVGNKNGRYLPNHNVVIDIGNNADELGVPSFIDQNPTSRCRMGTTRERCRLELGVVENSNNPTRSPKFNQGFQGPGSRPHDILAIEQFLNELGPVPNPVDTGTFLTNGSPRNGPIVPRSVTFGEELNCPRRIYSDSKPTSRRLCDDRNNPMARKSGLKATKIHASLSDIALTRLRLDRNVDGLTKKVDAIDGKLGALRSQCYKFNKDRELLENYRSREKQAALVSRLQKIARFDLRNFIREEEALRASCERLQEQINGKMRNIQYAYDPSELKGIKRCYRRLLFSIEQPDDLAALKFSRESKMASGAYAVSEKRLLGEILFLENECRAIIERKTKDFQRAHGVDILIQRCDDHTRSIGEIEDRVREAKDKIDKLRVDSVKLSVGEKKKMRKIERQLSGFNARNVYNMIKKLNQEKNRLQDELDAELQSSNATEQIASSNSSNKKFPVQWHRRPNEDIPAHLNPSLCDKRKQLNDKRMACHRLISRVENQILSRPEIKQVGRLCHTDTFLKTGIKLGLPPECRPVKRRDHQSCMVELEFEGMQMYRKTTVGPTGSERFVFNGPECKDLASGELVHEGRAIGKPSVNMIEDFEKAEIPLPPPTDGLVTVLRDIRRSLHTYDVEHAKIA